MEKNKYMNQTEDHNIKIICDFFSAFIEQDKQLADKLLTEDFTFTSQYDDRINKETYFEKCWPNKDRIKHQEIEKIIAQDNEAFILYKSELVDGSKFRNTEHIILSDGQIKEVNVYFGANY